MIYKKDKNKGTKNYYYIDFDDTTVKPVILFWQEALPMLKKCSKESEKRLKNTPGSFGIRC